jgi:hypothetical protein
MCVGDAIEIPNEQRIQPLMDEKKVAKLLRFKKEPEAKPTSLVKAGGGLLEIIHSAQRILASHVHHEGISQAETINRLFDLLDGPKCRKAEAVWTVSAYTRPTP